MLGSGGGIEHKFSERRHLAVVGIQQDCPDFIGNRAPPRLTGQRCAEAVSSQPLGQEPYLGGFAGTFNPFKCNEKAH